MRLRVGRRDVLRGAAVLVLPFAVPATVGACTEDAKPSENFKHGVASGDPLPDAVMLWTRVTTDAASVDVEWEIAEDPDMSKKVTGGSLKTDAERDYTVKVDAKGLQPGKTYYYRFKALGGASAIGRTRTAPAGSVSRLRFALVSCSSFAHGYFHTYREVAEALDLDAVIHLGDYIYEYGSNEYGDVRAYEPETEIKTLADYRTRHSLYKRDKDLQAAHQQHPFITIWDDHEIANDGFKDGAQNHTEGAEGAWAARKAAAQRAYREWMPIRDQSDDNIYRKLAFGDLADLILLDTRYYGRSKQDVGVTGAPPPPDPKRTILGDEQEAWMQDQVKTSKAKWKLLGQQIMVGQLLIEQGKSLANGDQWHGYPEARKRLLEFFRDSGVKDIVVLTGDIHSSWAHELVFDPNDPASYDPATGKGSVAVEIVTPAVTSPGIPQVFLGLVDTARPFNQHARWFELTKRGFVILDITPDRLQSAWYHFDDIALPDPIKAGFVKAMSVSTGTTRWKDDPNPADPRSDVPKAAPT